MWYQMCLSLTVMQYEDLIKDRGEELKGLLQLVVEYMLLRGRRDVVWQAKQASAYEVLGNTWIRYEELIVDYGKCKAFTLA